MGEIVQFSAKKIKKKRQAGKTLCLNGFHKWEVKKNNQFDSQQGKLISVYVCIRCGKTKNKKT
ncbi:MAG: hypothetical protein HRU38_09930 [Saccharospirillaceae bacterium]|nr:hypothetical protein [Pseudomonadales bacterium]NRB78972.1 hypothetical protein [Saccharospirillaceae bacterium]